MEYLVYTDESGLTPDEKYMLIGALIVPAELHATIKNELLQVFARAKGSARKSRNRFLLKLLHDADYTKLATIIREEKNAFEMKYSNINSLNYHFYQAFVDIIFRYPVSFCSLVIEKANGKDIFSHWDLFVNRYVLLLEQNMSRKFRDTDGFTLICDEVTTPRTSRQQFEDALIHKIRTRLQKHAHMTHDKNIRHIRSAITVSSHASLLSQATDLLLGAVSCAMRQKQSLSVKSQKIVFTAYIQERLGIENLCTNQTKKDPIYFSVWHYSK